MGGTCAVREEPGKQKPRSCRAQELARSRAQKNAGQKKAACRTYSLIEVGMESRLGGTLRSKKPLSWTFNLT